jgi:hypothetical protein
MVRAEASSNSAESISRRRLLLSKSICAIQSTRDNGDGERGGFTELAAGTPIEICGDGFNKRSLSIFANNRRYFVFIRDLDDICEFATIQ